eukprot:CAMPEP_0197853076 /NCGR_PEP_ID=MMETSP1438-20131217/22031_1 /TAXON_ID=1461541 /ORGANISM="Pterosperma sp., Strain CCMP1384" /LENGTH=117 /DNA_ID=CAMNT_0043467359 /DNA_START=110 /DNA_END=459 /DNA_ORIENTATION=-
MAWPLTLNQFINGHQVINNPQAHPAGLAKIESSQEIVVSAPAALAHVSDGVPEAGDAPVGSAGASAQPSGLAYTVWLHGRTSNAPAGRPYFPDAQSSDDKPLCSGFISTATGTLAAG